MRDFTKIASIYRRAIRNVIYTGIKAHYVLCTAISQPAGQPCCVTGSCAVRVLPGGPAPRLLPYRGAAPGLGAAKERHWAGLAALVLRRN